MRRRGPTNKTLSSSDPDWDMAWGHVMTGLVFRVSPQLQLSTSLTLKIMKIFQKLIGPVFRDKWRGKISKISKVEWAWENQYLHYLLSTPSALAESWYSIKTITIISIGDQMWRPALEVMWRQVWSDDRIRTMPWRQLSAAAAMLRGKHSSVPRLIIVDQLMHWGDHWTDSDHLRCHDW